MQSVTLLDLTIVSKGEAIPMNLYRSILREFFATETFVDKLF